MKMSSSYLHIHSRLIMSQASLSDLRRVELHDDKMIFFMTDKQGKSTQCEFHCQTKEEAESLMKETHAALIQQQQTQQPPSSQASPENEIQQQAVPTAQPRTKQRIWNVNGVDTQVNVPLHMFETHTKWL